MGLTLTEKILKALEEGTVPWQKPWIGSEKAVNYVTRKPYKGINTLLLDQPGEYLTFKQCTTLGGKVKKGEKAQMIVFFTFSEHKEKDANGEDKITKFPVLKYYNVFHLSQCEGIESKLEPPSPEADPLAEGENVINGYVARSGVGFEAVKGSEATDFTTLRSLIKMVESEDPELSPSHTGQNHKHTQTSYLRE